MAPLIPKLRGHFAEFLNNSSLAGLRILSSPTCVGLRYGRLYCVFGKQSLGPILCGHLSMAPLIPKLRGHFAEFLNNSSLAGLRILSSPTCVGVRYGRL